MLSHAYIDGFGSADCEISHEIKDSDCDYLDPILIVFSERGNKDELSLELYARKLTAAQAEGFANAFGEYANALRERDVAQASERGEPMIGAPVPTPVAVGGE